MLLPCPKRTKLRLFSLVLLTFWQHCRKAHGKNAIRESLWKYLLRIFGASLIQSLLRGYVNVAVFKEDAMNAYAMTNEQITAYGEALRLEERCEATVRKYTQKR